jgi:hypothetical protein
MRWLEVAISWSPPEGPDRANLDRIQIIKGCSAGRADARAWAYDVAAGRRTIDADGRSRTSVGSTADIANAT